jgi:hypothetical protein
LIRSISGIDEKGVLIPEALVSTTKIYPKTRWRLKPTKPKQYNRKKKKKKHENIQIKTTSGNTTKNQTAICVGDEGGGTAGGVDNPGEEVAGVGYCPGREERASAHEVHAQAHAVRAADREVSVVTVEWCV